MQNDDRTLAEIRWSGTMQAIIKSVWSGAQLRYVHEKTELANAGYYVVWYTTEPAGKVENSQYLGMHLPTVQYNIDQWRKERKGIVERGKYR